MTTLTSVIAIALFAVVAQAQLRNGQNRCNNPFDADGNGNPREPTNAGVYPMRQMTPDEASNCEFPLCTAIYKVKLDLEHTTQCNDYAMLPPHGINQLDEVFGCQNNPFFDGVPLSDYRDEPFKNDVGRQAAAKALDSVTALTERDSAFPLGFKLDKLFEYHGVCVEVWGVSDRKVPDRWIELMGQSVQQDRSFCVSDLDKQDLRKNVPQEACGVGELYQCRNAAVERRTSDNQKSIRLMFHCTENCDQNEMDFYWRVVASHETSSQNQEKADNEDWCMYRSGTDYPTSLLKPYPENYQPPGVFQKQSNAAAGANALGFPLLVLVALAASLLFLL